MSGVNKLGQRGREGGRNGGSVGEEGFEWGAWYTRAWCGKVLLGVKLIK